jgi:Sec-independent protein translocase protein TatA
MMMSGWAIFWIIVAALVVFGIVVNLRELIRYLKIRSM